MTHDIYLNGDYANNNPNYHIENSPWKANQILKMLRKHQIAPNTVCEVGCGAGEILNQLQNALPPSTKLSGYEISAKAIEFAKVRENENLTFYLEDVLKKETDLFDLMLCMDVIEHIEDNYSFLRELKAKAKYSVFHIPLDMNVQTVFRASPIMHVRKMVGHIHYFSKDTALSILEDTGYKIIDWFYTTSSANAKGLKPMLMRAPRKILHQINPDFGARLLGGYSLLALCTST